MSKALGEEKIKAREEAVKTIQQLRGKSIKTLRAAESSDLLIALCQLLGLVDKEGNIK
jgi:hypothetical protein